MMVRVSFFFPLAMLIAGCSEQPPAAEEVAVTEAPPAAAEPTERQPIPLTPEEIAELRGGEAATLKVLPAPGEVFAVMGMGERSGLTVDWAAMSGATVPALEPSDRDHTALATGAVISDFFVAVYQEDADAARSALDRLNTYADTLGVGAEARSSAGGLQAGLGSGDWRAVREGMDQIFDGVREKLSETPEGQRTAALIGTGAWTEALYLATTCVEASAEDMTALLRQPYVARHFSTVLADSASSPRVDGVREQLGVLQQGMTVAPNTAMSAEAITQISSSIEKLRQQII